LSENEEGGRDGDGEGMRVALLLEEREVSRIEQAVEVRMAGNGERSDERRGQRKRKGESSVHRVARRV
jgi:hypothetical protein